MPKIEVKRVQASMTISDMEPHWVAVVDHGAFQVEIPLPARYLINDEVYTQMHEFVEAMESLAEALTRYADQTRKRSLAGRS